ncbi:MAG: class I SAM-dependent methyltransferase [Gemmatimonadaceae bacterium]|nr:class I SAM-dependent methyltransferase [Gemmatimonadaceae bacterium]
MRRQPHSGPPKLYTELAAVWPVFSALAEYAEEAAFYRTTLEAASTRPLHRVLELGSGGGNNASHLKAHFEMTLVDPAAGMLEVSRAVNPECEHVSGDMRTVRLGRQFDGVFVHDAVCYMTTESDLRQAIESAFVHCAPGGAALFAPDHVTENFQASTDHGGDDGADVSVRYLEWTWDPDVADNTYTVDYAVMLRGRDGTVEVVHDRHIEGLFPRADWLRFLTDAGFEASVVPFEHSELEAGTYEVFVGRKPAQKQRGHVPTDG